jgi:putative SOS response-associated peptidase YedK
VCGRLNQFAKLPALSLAGRSLGLARRKSKAREDRRSAVQVLHNICPTDYADAFHLDARDELVLERMRFGLLPAWARGGKAEVSKKFLHTFNARCESVFDLASFRLPILHRRCLIPVRGWHEWPSRSAPFFIHHRDETPLLLAGIWEVWESALPEDAADGPVVTSMSVITTPPGRYLGKFHDRSPLILEGDAAWQWLQPGLSKDDLRAFFQPYDSPLLEAFRVSLAANQARNKSEEVFRPIAAPVPQEGDAPVILEPEDEAMPGLKLF